MDVGLGLLATAAAVRRLRPDADLVLSTDPDGLPWGVRSPEELTARAVLVAGAAAGFEPDALIVACNTACLVALPAIRDQLRPGTALLETVPPIADAVALGGPFAVWGTPAAVRSEGMRCLLRDLAADRAATPVACDGLSQAIERADDEAVAATLAEAVALTPPGVRSVSLACTHYDLIGPRIRTAFRLAGREVPVLHGTAPRLAAAALKALGLPPRSDAPATGGVTSLRSGRLEGLPPAALAYPEGRLLSRGLATAGPLLS
ncbi:glutamate racemase [Kitasatospora sp. NPDC006697]|uniref:glutamate racemase n=1 Tax=Kitasatospora sp. NPDC006697 TaxID=3364020 RepID=UPI0036B9D0FE